MKKSLLQTACEEELLKRKFARRASLNGAPASGPATDLLDEALAAARARVEKLRELSRLQMVITRLERQSLALEIGQDASVIHRIILMTAAWGHITERQLLSASRCLECFRPRAIACWLCRELTDAPLVAIGKAMHGQHHSTVAYACQTVENWMETDARLRTQVLTLKEEISRALTRVPNGSSALQHQSNHRITDDSATLILR